MNKKCIWCGKSFKGRADKWHCSDKCYANDKKKENDNRDEEMYENERR